jgi:hypothetical protein
MARPFARPLKRRTRSGKREKLAQMGHSLIPDDYADGYDESIGCEIDVPELLGKEFYTNTWDVSIECDYQEGIFMVAAYRNC